MEKERGRGSGRERERERERKREGEGEGEGDQSELPYLHLTRFHSVCLRTSLKTVSVCEQRQPGKLVNNAKYYLCQDVHIYNKCVH